MNESIYFSVIFPTNNRAKDVDETLSQLQKSTFKNFEVIIVDNNSTDKTYEISKKYNFVKYIKNDFNNYVVGARNQGVKEAKGEVILHIDDDSFPGIYAMERAYAVFEKNKDIGVISCGIKNYEIYKNEFANIKKIDEKIKYKETLTWSGCGGFVRKSLYEKYGPCDESGIHGFYELLICMWALKDNKKIMNYENIYVYHKVASGGIGGEVRGNDKMRNDEFYANSFFILKYYSYYKMIKKMFEIFYVISCATVEQRTTVYLKSYIKLLRNLKSILRDRNEYPHDITDKIRISFNFIGK